MRESPYLDLMEQCISEGLWIKCFDRSIDWGALTGQNLAFLIKRLAPLSERFTRTVEEAIEFAELVVLAHPDYVEALQGVPDKKILDLSGCFKSWRIC